MIRYHFDLYPRDDPKDGALLVRFTKLQSAEYRAESNGTGWGKFSIRGDTTDAGFIDPAGLQYVRVVREDTVAVTEEVIGGFFLDSGDFMALDEKGTRLLTFGGSGTLSYLAREVLWSHSYNYAADDPIIDSTWHFYNQPSIVGGDFLGAVLYRVTQEAGSFASPVVEVDDKPETAIPDVSTGPSMGIFNDSAGNAWTVPSGEFKAQIGENILTIVKRLMEAGLYIEMNPDTFVLNAWEQVAWPGHTPDSRGQDKTGAAWGLVGGVGTTYIVRFQAPTDGTIATGNVLSDAKRAVAPFTPRSAILAGDNGTYVVESVASDVPWHGFYANDSQDADTLSHMADSQIAARSGAGDTLRVRMKHGTDAANGEYLPLSDYDQGGIEPSGVVMLNDLVTVHTGTGQWDYNEDTFPVAALRLELREGGDWDAWAELGASYTSMAERAFQARGVGTHNHPPNPQLCRDTEGSLVDPFTRTEASGWGTSPIRDKTWVTSAIVGTYAVDGDEGVVTGTADNSGGAVLRELTGWTLPIELLIKQRWLNAIASASYGVTFRLADMDDTGSDPGFGSNLLTVAWLGSVAGGIDFIGELDADNIEVVDTGTIDAIDEADKTTAFWTRIRVSQSGATTTLEARSWSDGDAEPGTWDGTASTVESVAAYLAALDGMYFSPRLGTGSSWFLDSVEVVSGLEVDADTCIHGGPLATSGDAAEPCGKCTAPGNHEHDYVAAGGTTGQVLKKASGDDWDTDWEDESGGLPTDATYLVTAAHADLSAEVVVGATPGGELGGTWASPTVDATHSGSAHHTESHQARHANGGADEVAVEGLPTAETDTALVLHPDGTGGIEWGTDEGGSGIAGELVTDTIIGDGVEDTFALSDTPTGSWALVSTNGADLLPTEYAISGDDIIFDVAPVNLAEVLVTFITGGFTVPATDPGDIADPTLATAEDVALKLNALMANLRTAGIIV